MDTYLSVLKKYAQFKGRASRKEYWVFTLFNLALVAIAVILDNLLGITIEDMGLGPIYGVYLLAMVLPSLALAVRRLHDIGKSGSMIFISFIPAVGFVWLLILFATAGQAKENQYGAVPEGQDRDKTIDELILFFIIWSFLVSAFWGILPLAIQNFYQTMTFKISNTLISFVGGFVPLSLALVVKNKTKKILLVVLGGGIIVYHVFVIVGNLIN